MTTREYVTVAEIGFAPYLLNLHRSMVRHVPDFHLTVACADEEIRQLLTRLQLDRVSTLDLSSPSEPRLLSAQATRSRGEYCWTLTPILPRLVFEQDATVAEVTYIDADVYLLRQPTPVHEEFAKSGAACLITPHAFAPEWDASHTAGYFCVQYMPFRRQESEDILAAWADQCLDHCSATSGPFGLGDQGYVNDWPQKYGRRVHVTEHPNWFQGPWNAERFPYSEAITYHFHGLRLKSANRVWLGTNPIPRPTLRHVYEPYLHDLKESVSLVVDSGFGLSFSGHPMSTGQRLASTASRIVSMGWQMMPARSRVLPR